MLLDGNAFSDANNSAVVIFNVLNIFPYKLPILTDTWTG